MNCFCFACFVSSFGGSFFLNYSYSYVSLCLCKMYMLWCVLYTQTFHTSVPTIFVVCTFVRNYACAEQLKTN